MLTLCIADAERDAGMKNLSRKSDTINRQAAINAIIAEGRNVDSRYLESERIIHESDAVEALSMLPSAQPEPPSEIQDILNYLDTALHPIISPEHWNVYSELHDMISTLPSAQLEQTKMIKEIRDWINSGNRGSADYFIVDKIEEIINKYE